MSLPFNTQALPELSEEEMKILSAIIIQNGLMIQQLQLTMELQEKEQEAEREREHLRKEKEEEEKKEDEMKE